MPRRLADLSVLFGRINLSFFTQELAVVQSKLGALAETSVSLIEVDAVKSFDLTTALNKMRGEYEKSVQQHKEDAEIYFRAKVTYTERSMTTTQPC